MACIINFNEVQNYCSSFGLHGSDGYDDSEYSMDFHSSMSSLDAKRIEDDTYCNPNVSYVWCLPRDYNREKHPFTCKYYQAMIKFQKFIRLLTFQETKNGQSSISYNKDIKKPKSRVLLLNLPHNFGNIY